MSNYKVAEIFSGIIGSGVRSGELGVFVRLCGCNLGCTYCDKQWVNELNVSYTLLSEEEIVEKILKRGISNVILTGGEPLLTEDVQTLIDAILAVPELNLEVHTNGSVSIAPYTKGERRPWFKLVYKCPSSEMTRYMNLYNYDLLEGHDAVHFEIADRRDLEKAGEVIEAYGLNKKCRVLLTPMAGMMEPEEIADFMKKNKLSGVTLQLQLHKLIYGSQENEE